MSDTYAQPWNLHRLGGLLPSFDPEAGHSIMAPDMAAPGHWVGCPAVLFEPDTGRFLMTYRNRRPRGNDNERGWRCAIAESFDGRSFVDIWSVEKGDLRTLSMERFSLLKCPDDTYRLYLSYVDPADNRWRIDALEAEAPNTFSLESRREILTGSSTGTEGVKDPYTITVGPLVFMYCSVAAARPFTAGQRREAHATGDIHALGVTKLPSGLAVSTDGGRRFQWWGEVLPVGQSWDAYESRITSILALPGMFLGFYDGSSSAEENYEERCGLSLSFDLVNWTRLTTSGPWNSSPHSTGSLRYIDVVAVTDEFWFFYEYALADGSHDLRLSRVGSPFASLRSLSMRTGTQVGILGDGQRNADVPESVHKLKSAGLLDHSDPSVPKQPRR